MTFVISMVSKGLYPPDSLTGLLVGAYLIALLYFYEYTPSAFALHFYAHAKAAVVYLRQLRFANRTPK